jgi:thiamine biosynthesis lipoprotein
LTFFRPRTLLPVAGLTALALLCSDCKHRSVAWNTSPVPTLDASVPEAGLEVDAGAAAPSSGAKRVEAKDVAMGTSVTFVAFTNDKVDESGVRTLFAKALDEIKRLETLLSEWREDSDIGRVNRGAGEWVSVAPETLEVIRHGLAAGKQSDGTFDITFQAMSDLWKFGDAK